MGSPFLSDQIFGGSTVQDFLGGSAAGKSGGSPGIGAAIGTAIMPGIGTIAGGLFDAVGGSGMFGGGSDSSLSTSAAYSGIGGFNTGDFSLGMNKQTLYVIGFIVLVWLIIKARK